MFDGVPTFALTDHALEFSCRQTTILNNMFFKDIEK